MTSDFVLALQDMTPDEIFADKKFAQELELSKDNYFRELMPSEASTHGCSSRILEVDRLYAASKEKRVAYYNAVKEFYKDKLPLGGDGYLSGGNHYHIFFETRYEIQKMYSWDPDFVKDIYSFIKAVPLFAKFKKLDDGTKKFFSRRNWGHNATSRIEQSKSIGISAKRSYASSENRVRGWSDGPTGIEDTTSVQSLEFRMNGVIDNRIYGFYQAALIYAIDKQFGKVKTLGVTGTAIYQGIRSGLDSSHCDVAGDCFTLEKLHSLGEGFTMDSKLEDKLAFNVNIALNLLTKYGLTNSAAALKEYIDEF